MIQSELKAFLEVICGEFGFSHAGFTSLEKTPSIEKYRAWLSEGLHGRMQYLESHADLKENPSVRYPFARTAFVFAVPYVPHPEGEAFPLAVARVAAYARGGDYHDWLKARLRDVIARLREKFPSAHFEAHTDSSPLPERDLAVRAGIGWIGRNSCVLDRRHGSFFLLGEILADIVVTDATNEVVADFCGRCQKCVESCPTNAILPDRRLDARKCISYLSIESREIPATELRKPWGDWLFGCDICQSVCPWNAKPFSPSVNDQRAVQNLSELEEDRLIEELRGLLVESGKSIERRFANTALARAGSFGLKRNALIVAANRGLKSLRPDIEKLLAHPRLGELARWTLAEWNDGATSPASS